MDDGKLSKDIEMAWEEFRGTTEGEKVCRLGYFTMVAITFCRYYIKTRGLDGDGKDR
jgi:hypothetical protein